MRSQTRHADDNLFATRTPYINIIRMSFASGADLFFCVHGLLFVLLVFCFIFVVCVWVTANYHWMRLLLWASHNILKNKIRRDTHVRTHKKRLRRWEGKHGYFRDAAIMGPAMMCWWMLITFGMENEQNWRLFDRLAPGVLVATCQIFRFFSKR